MHFGAKVSKNTTFANQKAIFIQNMLDSTEVGTFSVSRYLGLKENVLNIFAMIPHVAHFGPFSVTIILVFFYALKLNGAQGREVVQLQKVFLFLKSRNPELSFDILCYGVYIHI